MPRRAQLHTPAAAIACLAALLLAVTLVAPSPALAQSAAGNEVVVAGVPVRYGDAWVYDDANSVPSERIYFDAADRSLPRFYGLFVEANPGIDAPTARDGFATSYLEIIGATGVQQVAVGSASTGTAWAVHRADQGGAPAVIVVYVDLAAIDGQILVHLLFTVPGDLSAALTEAQASIQVNGALPFRDLDPSTLLSPASTAPQTAPEPGVTLPDAYVGIWSGTGTETDPPATWPITVAFRGGGVDQVVGTATYPTLACGADLVLRSVDPATGSIEVVEDITTGEANCTDGGAMMFERANGAEQVSFTWVGPGGTGTGQGTLQPVRASSQTVGASTVAFSVDWAEQTTSPDPTSLVLSHGVMPATLYHYSELPGTAGASPSSALAEVEAGFFNGFGDGNQVVVASGALSSGAEWRLYSVNREGVPFAVLIVADLAAQPGQVALSILLSPVEAIGLATQVVQDTIGIAERGSPLAGIVPAELEAALSAT